MKHLIILLTLIFSVQCMAYSSNREGKLDKIINCRSIGNEIPSNLTSYSAIYDIKSSPSSYKCGADYRKNGHIAVVAYNKYPVTGKLAILVVFADKDSPCKEWGLGEECGLYLTKSSYGYSSYIKDKWGNVRVGNNITSYYYNQIEDLVKQLF